MNGLKADWGKKPAYHSVSGWRPISYHCSISLNMPMFMPGSYVYCAMFVLVYEYAYSTWSIRCLPYTTVTYNLYIDLRIYIIVLLLQWIKKNRTKIENINAKIGRAEKKVPSHFHIFSIKNKIHCTSCSMTIIKLDGKSYRKIIELRILYYLHDDINTSDMICY